MSQTEESDLYWYKVLVIWQNQGYLEPKNHTFSKKALSIHKTLDEAQDYVNLCKKELTNISDYKIVKLKEPLT